ncbi:MAG: PH domain-containing protein [Thaumarchaeota archaeon]|nr:PH domain-containing protein [Nitrososphaerota archaeon]
MQSTPDDLKSLLGPDELVQLVIEQRIYHPKIDIDSVIITNERIILRHPGAVRPRKDYTDFNYRDISNVNIEKGILRSTVKCAVRLGGDPLALSDLPNSDAESAYGLIRENLLRHQPSSVPPTAGPPPPYRQGSPPPTFSLAACRKCGARIGVGRKFCRNCGLPV